MSTGDLGDRLELFGLAEDPERFETAIADCQRRAAGDPEMAQLLEATFYDADRAAAFERFGDGAELRAIVKLMRHLGVDGSTRIVEVGGGPGFLTWALRREGFTIELVEPNPCFVTGTGYLRTRPDAQGLTIWNDLGAWYGSGREYDLVLTHNCVHHFRSISFVAACLRQRLRPDGRWLMVREWYAESAEETFAQLARHPLSQRFSLYEFPYPAEHYVSSLENVGFDLELVLPAGVDNGALEAYVTGQGSAFNRLYTQGALGLAGALPWLTRTAFRAEQAWNRWGPRRVGLYSRPAVLGFRRRALTTG